MEISISIELLRNVVLHLTLESSSCKCNERRHESTGTPARAIRLASKINTHMRCRNVSRCVLSRILNFNLVATFWNKHKYAEFQNFPLHQFNRTWNCVLCLYAGTDISSHARYNSNIYELHSSILLVYLKIIYPFYQFTSVPIGDSLW